MRSHGVLAACMAAAAVAQQTEEVGPYLFVVGYNPHGNLGDGTWDSPRYNLLSVTTDVGGAVGALGAVCGGAHHGIVLKADGTVWATVCYRKLASSTYYMQK
eukprot:SAG31_NODE_6946_length_1840_cov_2.721999_1_plen_102_part_00